MLACYKWGDWKNYWEYYPTILFAIIGCTAYNFIFYNYDLWKYEKLVSHTFSNYLIAITVYPSAVILFLTHYPKDLLKQGLYILGWTALNSTIEYISLTLGGLSYYHGWNIFWTMGLYFFAFILLRLHYKKPLAAWPISAVFLLLTILIFKFPISNVK